MADRNGYIGRAPGDSAVQVARQDFTPTGVQTNFTFDAGYTPGYLDVYLNGSKLVVAQDFTATDGSVVGLTSAAASGDIIELVAFKAFNAASVNNAGTLTVSGNQTNNGTLSVTGGTTLSNLNVSGISTLGTVSGLDLNGSVLTLDADGDTTITADTDDQIDIAFGGNDRITLSTGLIDLKNDGSQSAIRFYCESSNAHYAALQAPAHSAFSGNITLTLPATTDTLVARTTTDTLTNKTLTSPTISTPTLTGGVGIADSIFHTGDTNTQLRFPAADTFTVETSGSEALRVQSDGDVGIGTINNSNNERLRVQDDATTSTSCQLSIISGNAERAILNFGDKEDANIGRVTYDNSDNHLSLFTNNTEALRITSAGLVGIGSDTPSRMLVVSGADPIIRSEDSDNVSDFAEFKQLTGVLYIDSRNGASDGTIVFRGVGGGSATEKARIDSAGDLGLGVTPNNMGSMRTLHIKGPSGEGAAIRLQDNGDTADSDDYVIYKNASAAYLRVNGTDPLRFFLNGADRMLLDSSGRLAIANDTPSSFTGNGSDNLVVGSGSGDEGITVYSGSSNQGSISFGDGTSGDAAYRGAVEYNHSTDKLQFRAGGVANRVTIDNAGLIDAAGGAEFGGIITAQAGAVAEIGALSDGATITPDFATHCNFSVTLGGNRTLANPSNLTAGQSGSIFLIQDGTGSRTITFGSNYDFAGGTAPTLSTAASSVDRLDYFVRTSSSIHCVVTLAYS